MGWAMQERSTLSQRTYFVQGHRVEETRDAFGYSSWTCDCAEYARSRTREAEPGCAHSEHVAAAASVDRLLGAKGLALRAGGC